MKLLVAAVFEVVVDHRRGEDAGVGLEADPALDRDDPTGAGPLVTERVEHTVAPASGADGAKS